MFFQTDTWQNLSSFDERYFPAAGVDVDFCLALRSSGLRVICTDLVDVVHASGAMMRSDRAEGDRALRTFLIRQHHAILGRHWAPFLERRAHFPNSDDELRTVVARYWEDSLFEIAGAGHAQRVADRSITGGDLLIEDRVPEGVSFRAASRRTEVLEDCIAWTVREAFETGRGLEGAAAVRLAAESERQLIPLAAIERSRTWKARNAAMRLLPSRWRLGRT